MLRKERGHNYVRKPKKENRERISRRLLSQPRCFYVFLGLTGLQALGLIILGNLVDYHNPGDADDGTSRSLRSYDNGAQDTKTLCGVARGASVLTSFLSLENHEPSHLEPIDNYYSRLHITPTDEHDKPVLIIGGSDGSGTRAFVDTLGHLGVPILVDDEETLDIHAEPLCHGQGWPPLVQRVLNETLSGNYNFEDLPTEVQSELLEQMRLFQQHYDIRVARLLHGAQIDGKDLPTSVEYGFKAPVSMLLLPLFQQIYGRIKFLHVVRDGRDVALSSNKSPVDKFFDVYYRDASDRRAEYAGTGTVGFNESTKDVLAMQLWNDWNTQVLEWERLNSDGESFDFLVMRTEDLLNPETRLDAFLELADFVGSPKTKQEICCLSERELVDMGASAVTSGSDITNSQKLPGVQNRLFGHKANPTTHSKWAHDENFGNVGTRDKFDDLRRDEAIRKAIRALGSEQKKAMDSEDRLSSVMESQKQRRLLATAPGEEIIQRLMHLNEEAARQAEAMAEQARAQASEGENDSMLELVEVERRRHQRGDKLLGSISDPAMKEKFRKFMDQHNNNPPRQKGRDVKQRYGKWVSKLENKPELSAVLHKEGAAGLEAFGYHPAAQFLQRKHHIVQCQVCQEEPENKHTTHGSRR